MQALLKLMLANALRGTSVNTFIYVDKFHRFYDDNGSNVVYLTSSG